MNDRGLWQWLLQRTISGFARTNSENIANKSSRNTQHSAGFRPVRKSDALTSRSWITGSGVDRLTDEPTLLIRPLHRTACGAHITCVSCVYLRLWIGQVSGVSVTNARFFTWDVVSHSAKNLDCERFMSCRHKKNQPMSSSDIPNNSFSVPVLCSYRKLRFLSTHN